MGWWLGPLRAVAAGGTAPLAAGSWQGGAAGLHRVTPGRCGTAHATWWRCACVYVRLHEYTQVIEYCIKVAARRRYAALAAAWREAVPEPLVAHCRPGRVRRGVLEVFVSHSAVSQEFVFHKPAVLARLKAALPAVAITDIRCRLADTPAGP